ncbi:MAG: hypothetical protein MUE53_03065 [Chitinophagales bacterium]|nr:hypothetical protein [Chitinophagales bacterium]
MFFTESFIEYESYSGFVHSKNLKNIYISLPLLLRFKTMPINDFRIFVLGGMCYNINIVEQKIPKFDQSFIAMTRNAISFEYGVGLQYFFKYFIFSPEIKFGHYMQSHLESIQSPLNNSILNQVYPKYFIISLNFEG